MAVISGKDNRGKIHQVQPTDNIPHGASHGGQDLKYRSGATPARRQIQNAMSGVSATVMTTAIIVTGAFGILPNNPITSSFRQVVSENVPETFLSPVNSFLESSNVSKMPPLVSKKKNGQNKKASSDAPDPFGFIANLISPTEIVPTPPAAETPVADATPIGPDLLGFLENIISPTEIVPTPPGAATPVAAATPSGPDLLGFLSNIISPTEVVPTPPGAATPVAAATPSGPDLLGFLSNIISPTEIVPTPPGAATPVAAATPSGPDLLGFLSNIISPTEVVPTLPGAATPVAAATPRGPDLLGFLSNIISPTDSVPTPPGAGTPGAAATSSGSDFLGFLVNLISPAVSTPLPPGSQTPGAATPNSPGLLSFLVDLFSPTQSVPATAIAQVPIANSTTASEGQIPSGDATAQPTTSELTPIVVSTPAIFSTPVPGQATSLPGATAVPVNLPPAATAAATTTKKPPLNVPPKVLSVSPADGSSGVLPAARIKVTFNEAVNADISSFELSCESINKPFTISGSGSNVVTIIPNSNLPVTSLCSVLVVGASVSEAAGSNPALVMESDYPFIFSTIDYAPGLLSTIPSNGASNVSINSNVVIYFNEAVEASDASFMVNCDGARAFSSSGSGTGSITLNFSSALPYSKNCTVSIIGSLINDLDTIDPPDTMTGTYTFTFSTPDFAPTITGTTPSDGASDVLINNNITVNFSEAVNVTNASFTLDCGGVRNFSTSGSGTANIVISPTTALPNSSSCTVTVIAAQVSDVDAVDPPDKLAADHTFTFTTRDLAPSVSSTNPANNATNTALNNTVINFREAVNVTNASFSVDCAGSAQTFNALGSGTASITLLFTPDLTNGASCTVTVIAAQVSDVDSLDPPDTMAADYTFVFTTKSAPAQVLKIDSVANNGNVVSNPTSPTNLDVSLANSAILFTFNSGISISTSGITIDACSGNQIKFNNDNDPTLLELIIGVDPADPASANPGPCTVTLRRLQIVATDSNYSPMPNNFVLNVNIVP